MGKSGKNTIKNLLRVLGFIAFMFYIGTFSIGSGSNGGGCSDKSQHQDLDNDGVPDVQTLHEKVLAASENIRDGWVSWVNRDWVLTADGALYSDGYGLGYSGLSLDDLSAFRDHVNSSYTDGMSWSQYPCATQPDPMPTVYRPGQRLYCSDPCDKLPGGADPCWPQDCYNPGHSSENCWYQWAGSPCFAFVVYALKAADSEKFAGLKANMDAEQVRDYVIDHDYAKYVTRDEAVPGDLILMDIDHDGSYIDHIGVISDKRIYFEDDCIMGNIGFYSSPFKYKAHEAAITDFNSALQAEWGPYSYPEDEDGWQVLLSHVQYVHIKDYDE